jgi:hypothetical protein
MDIKTLPCHEEDAQVNIVHTILSKHLTTYQAQLKKVASTKYDSQLFQLQASVKESSDTHNIVALAESLVGNTKLQPTLQL